MTCSRFAANDPQKVFDCTVHLVLPPKGFSQKVIKGDSLKQIGKRITGILEDMKIQNPFPNGLQPVDLIGSNGVGSDLTTESRYHADDNNNLYFDVNTIGKLKPYIPTLQGASDANIEVKSILTWRYGNTAVGDFLTSVWDNAPKIVLGFIVLLIALALLSEDPSAYIPKSLHNALSTSTTGNKLGKGAVWWRDNVHLFEDNQPNQQKRRNRQPTLVDHIRSGVEQARGPLKNPSLLIPFLDQPDRKMIDFFEPQEGTLANLKGVSTQNQPTNRNPRRPPNQLPQLARPTDVV